MKNLHPGMKVLSLIEVEHRASGSVKSLPAWLATLPTTELNALLADETDKVAKEVLSAIMSNRAQRGEL